jgi:hypothetical protein
VARSAEDLRALVATTAATALQNQQQQFNALSARITQLEQLGAEGKGKQTFQDPVIANLLQQVQTLLQARSAQTGSSEGATQLWVVLLGGFLALIGLGGLLLNLWRTQARVT